MNTLLHTAFIRCALAFMAAVLFPAAVLAQAPWPSEAPEQWGLAIIDVETTGLDPGRHEMIDIGAIYTDLEGNELGRFFTRIMPPHPERIDPAASAVNGYSEERWRALGAVDEAEAVADFLAFHTRVADGRRMVFTAYNAQFDHGFVSALLSRHGHRFDDHYTYFLLDIPSMAWGQGLKVLGNSLLAAELGLPDETRDPLQHTGITGAEWNLSLYRALLGRLDRGSDPGVREQDASLP